MEGNLAREPGVFAPPTTGWVAFRWTDYDVPLWARSSSAPARWHHLGDGPTQYLSLHPLGAWAELVRSLGIREQAVLDELRMPIWAIRVLHGRFADYSTFERADAGGFSPLALVDDDHTGCRDEGRRLREAGWQGVAALSAALPGVVNLTIFGARRAATWGVEPVLASDMPACRVAVGSPPPDLLPKVRYRGERIYPGIGDFLAPDELAEPRLFEPE